jgi:P pilus assembly chaperone PapD
MNCIRRIFLSAMMATTGIVVPLHAAQAALALSQMVVELSPREHQRADVEAWNDGAERIYVAIDPREIVNPGTAAESSRSDPDPDKLGLLVSPARMILEPGQRKLLRIGSISANDRERVYRITVKPVLGQLASESSGLKVLVGYDMLVLVRPPEPRPHVSGKRSGNQLTLTNDGNVSVELAEGRACDVSKRSCEDLSGGRIYAGAEKTIDVGPDRKVDYKMKVGTTLTSTQF